MSPGTGKSADQTPMTGADYLASLDDGRTVYIYGERVAKVSEHPAFRNTARMIARLFDAMHDPEQQSKLMVPTDSGNGGMTHAFFKAPKTAQDLIAGGRRSRRGQGSPMAG
jgi:aromatic ring hydroxylase